MHSTGPDPAATGRRLRQAACLLCVAAAVAMGGAGARQGNAFAQERSSVAQAGKGGGDVGGSLAAAASSGVEIPPGTYPVQGSLRIPRDVSFAPGARVDLAAGATIVFAGNVDAAPTQQLFLGQGSVDLAGQRAPVYAEWWGARADNSTVSSPAFQKAADALTAGGTINALTGSYKFDCDAGDDPSS